MASKFHMVDPAAGEDVMAIMAQQVNDRMGKALEDLGAKYQDGKAAPPNDDSVDAPTGASYRAVQADERRKEAVARKREKEREESRRQEAREAELIQQLEQQGLSDDNLDDEGEDHELMRIREKRMQEMKAAFQEKQENLTKGHGQYREITQDEFLPEVTSSQKVICHFYHADFIRCKIMDKHLALLAPNHVEAKFIKINAEKAPFFVGKLQIRVLPTVVLFIDGVMKEKISGFDGLTEGMERGKEDEFPTSRLGQRLAQAGMIRYTAPPTEAELQKLGLANRGSVYATMAQLSDDDLSD